MIPRRVMKVGVAAALALLAGRAARADDPGLAVRAREATLELDTQRARTLLSSGNSSDPSVALEQARMLLYEGDCDGAVATLGRPSQARDDVGVELLAVAHGCARATAATRSLYDRERGVSIRFQDEDDMPLGPFLAEVAAIVRDRIAEDLGADLPRPLRIELVRDIFALSEMTGLAESSARTTGTVAVAKWGRITMLSPRALRHGYPWADTLAHEMAHLAVTRATRDRAPLWLQEAVAKREETRWREARPLDDFPPADQIAAVGLDRGLLIPIQKLGASIAMLPTAEHATVAFAGVASFLRFWAANSHEQALSELLVQLRDADGPRAVDEAMQRVSGQPFAGWNERWLGHLAGVPHRLPDDFSLGQPIPHQQDLGRSLTLADLLGRRAHHEAAREVLQSAQKLAPHDPLLRHRLASSLVALGRDDEAKLAISGPEAVHAEYGPWFAMYGRSVRREGDPARAAKAFQVGLWISPLDPEVACEGNLPPELALSSQKKPLCEAARSTLQH
jgi:hypothetical protein